MTIRQIERCKECDNFAWDNYDCDIHMCVDCAKNWNIEGEDA